MVAEIYPGQDFQTQGHYAKVKSRSDHDVAHLHSPTNVPAKYELPTPYGFLDTARTNYFPPPALPPIRTPWVKTITCKYMFYLYCIQGPRWQSGNTLASHL